MLMRMLLASRIAWCVAGGSRRMRCMCVLRWLCVCSCSCWFPGPCFRGFTAQVLFVLIARFRLILVVSEALQSCYPSAPNDAGLQVGDNSIDLIGGQLASRWL